MMWTNRHAVLAGVGLVLLSCFSSLPADTNNRLRPSARTPGSSEMAAKYLGLSYAFVRWPQGVVPWVYDPSGAPDTFDDPARTVALIQQAMDEWSGVSGIRFDYRGTTRRISSENNNDGIVVVHWMDAPRSRWTAQAGPTWRGQVDTTLGYRPIVDGAVHLNAADPAIAKTRNSPTVLQETFLSTVTHELGHLIGFGHSDNPSSIMYSNPYNDILHLTDDDIRAAQALYGLPEEYRDPPRLADVALSSDPYFLDSGVETEDEKPIERISNGSAGIVMARVKYAGGFNGVVGLTVVDADGQILKHEQYNKSCEAGYTCETRAGLVSAVDLGRLPGTKTVYVDLNGRYVSAHRLPVETMARPNRMPQASLTSRITEAGDAAILRLEVGRDPEGDDLAGTWHIPGEGEEAFEIGPKGGVFEREVRFALPGDYVVFVSLIDDAPRYGKPGSGSAAGEGFRLAFQKGFTVE